KHDSTRIDRNLFLETRADKRRLRVEKRHGLALHVRTHERAVRVVMLEERNERRGDRDELLGRDVHVIDMTRPSERYVALGAREHELLDETAVGVQRRVGL